MFKIDKDTCNLYQSLTKPEVTNKRFAELFLEDGFKSCKLCGGINECKEVVKEKVDSLVEINKGEITIVFEEKDEHI